MNDHIRKYLIDVQNAIALIETFTGETPDFSAYQADLKTQSAVERQLAIVGEAVNKLRQETNGIVLGKTKEIVDFRNRLIHAYDNVDISIVWAVLKNHLPVLKAEVANLLEPPDAGFISRSR